MKIISIFFCCLYLYGNNEFIVSYKAIVNDYVLAGEEYTLTRALTKSSNYIVVGYCDFITDDIDLDSKLIDILANNRDSIIDCLHGSGKISITDNLLSINNAIKHTTRFEIKPHRIIAFLIGNKVHIKFIERVK